MKQKSKRLVDFVTAENKEFIEKTLKENNTVEASKIIGIPEHSVYRLRKILNIPTPHNQSVAARKFTLNHSFFETIDSEEKAYILGFLAADGNVNPDKYGCEIRIVLNPKDVDILEKINTCWESTYSVKDHKLGQFSGFPGSCKEQKKLSIRSTQMQIDLAKYFIVPNKTLTLRYPNIPDQLDRHFLRGFLDGDGWVTKQDFGWTTNRNMANDVQRICMKHGFKELRRYNIKQHSDVVKGGPVYKEIVDWLYQDATIFLDRKKAFYDLYWKNRIYKVCRSSYPPAVKHIPCALEALPPVLGSVP